MAGVPKAQDDNLGSLSKDRFEQPETVAFYAANADLFGAESHLFQRFIGPGDAVLDLGVGAGRTAGYLAEHSGRYVGLDYSHEMVAECLRLMPELEFVQGDAADLSAFPDATFDVVVFSFNGLDCLWPEANRAACLSEIRRVLRRGGVAILSSHNAHAFLRSPKAWRGVSWKLGTVRVAHATRESAKRLARILRNRELRSGGGYSFDEAHGGVYWYATTPERFTDEVVRAGFTPATEVLDYEYPKPFRRWRTNWYYRAFTSRA